MIASAELRSGKGHRDENFPVASRLIQRRHRPTILAFYEFVRVADDIADHATLDPREKIARLDRLETNLLGKADDEPVGGALRRALAERGLSTRHAQDLLKAFRQDALKSRYEDWNDLIGYCTYSAMPVGRFVLDVHGESKATWAASDALCAALQIINHLQDCATDYRKLDRVYLPLDILAEHGAKVETLREPRANPALLACLHDLARRTAVLLQESRTFPDMVVDTRLAMEIAAIETLAARLVLLLQTRDPLHDAVHLTKTEAMRTGAKGAAAQFFRAFFRKASTFHRQRAHEC
jgi:hydroxysqualene synthase